MPQRLDWLPVINHVNRYNVVCEPQTSGLSKWSGLIPARVQPRENGGRRHTGAAQRIVATGPRSIMTILRGPAHGRSGPGARGRGFPAPGVWVIGLGARVSGPESVATRAREPGYWRYNHIREVGVDAGTARERRGQMVQMSLNFNKM